MASYAGSCRSRVSPKSYDVFISFRGEDTRITLTSHLYHALINRGINTYIDYDLEKGHEIWGKLCSAIESSHISVVVFSEDYASSKWCLEELAKIMECRRDLGQVVIPVFYKTDPSHIRNQEASFQKSFEEHEENLGDDESKQQKLGRWRAALTEAAVLPGWDSQSPANKDNYQLIHNIVNHVWWKLELMNSNAIKGLVGIDEICRHIELLLKNAQIIGIWGMGGVGKTTIAKAVFTKLHFQYDSVCFLENVSEQEKRHDLAYLRRNLLLELLKEDKPIQKVVESTLTTRSLNSKKVLIVLDDVDSVEQLEYLCGAGDLRADSKLIITTRNKRLLIGRVNYKIYEVERLNLRQSLKLFSLHAFNKSYPEEGYEQLSKQVIEYAGGIPLALKVLGSYLRSRPTIFWESTLRKLRKCPNEKIHNVLKVSYDGLDNFEKKIFLDIAFFFREENKHRVIRVLDACGYEASSGIDVLEDKALITISYNNRIQMHDLLLEMGLEIVRQECDPIPGRRSRLRDIEDVREVFKNNTGTDAVEGITLDLSQITDLNLSSDTFKTMNNIRFLKFYIPVGQSSSNRYLPSALKQFPEKLRYLQWDGYPSKYLPQSFCAKLLVEIHMPYSDVEELWRVMQDLKNLEVIDLCGCRRLRKLPDLSKASRLKWVNLSGCENLRYLHPSVLYSDTLDTLILDRCKNLKSVKSEKSLVSLKKISVNDCKSLEEFAVRSDLIEKLDLSKTAIKTLHESIRHLNNLKSLNLEGLRLKHLSKELSCLQSLKDLNLSRSRLVFIKDQLHDSFNGLHSLQILHLKDCSNLFELPDNIGVLSQLRELRLDGSSINTLPESIKHLQKLEILSLENCNELVSLPKLPPLIKELYANNCTLLVSVSNLKSLATRMVGSKKRISFKNCLKMDEDSLSSITDSLHLTMMSAAFHNVLVRVSNTDLHNHNHNMVHACLPGSCVSRHFTNQTTDSFITIRLNPASVLGIILSVVLSPLSLGMKERGAEILCQCYSADGTNICNNTGLYYEDISNLDSDTVFVWYDPYFSESILRTYEPQVSFKFLCSTKEGDRLVVMKECGVRLIRHSEFHRVLEEMELEFEKKVELGVKLELTSDMWMDSKSGMHKLWFSLEYGWPLEPSMKFELELRRKEMVAVMEKQMQKSNEFIFPPRPTRMWKNCTQGLRDLLLS